MASRAQDPLCAQYGLLGKAGSEQHAAEERILCKCKLDAQGGRTWQMLMMWSLSVIDRQAKLGAIAPPLHAQMVKLVTDLGDATGNLFAFSYQVRPRASRTLHPASYIPPQPLA